MYLEPTENVQDFVVIGIGIWIQDRIFEFFTIAR